MELKVQLVILLAGTIVICVTEGSLWKVRPSYYFFNEYHFFHVAPKLRGVLTGVAVVTIDDFPVRSMYSKILST